jgi:hypothetical protein
MCKVLQRGVLRARMPRSWQRARARDFACEHVHASACESVRDCGCVRVCVHVHACFDARAVSHWPQHKKECSKLGGSRSGSKQDRHAEPAAETQAAQGTRLGEGKAEGGTAAGRGVGGVRSPGEVGRVCSTCGLAGTELKECAECHSTWCCVPACSLVREMLDGTPARKRPPTAPPSRAFPTLACYCNHWQVLQQRLPADSLEERAQTRVRRPENAARPASRVC